jgi:hypothetical protein
MIDSFYFTFASIVITGILISKEQKKNEVLRGEFLPSACLAVVSLLSDPHADNHQTVMRAR